MTEAIWPALQVGRSDSTCQSVYISRRFIISQKCVSAIVAINFAALTGLFFLVYLTVDYGPEDAQSQQATDTTVIQTTVTPSGKDHWS